MIDRVSQSAPKAPAEQSAQEAPSASGVTVAETVAALRRQVNAWRRSGETIALVPTMGFLHAGHMALVEAARAGSDRVVVSIFVNPKQFGPNEDFESYPRDHEGDLAKLAAAGVDLAFVPDVAGMYGRDFATTVSVAGLTEGLCGAARPGHFDGVSTVVTKLFLQCLPDVAWFGEKDYQQLQMIRRMVGDLDMPLSIAALETVREADGLAMSSRNAYLDTDQRRRAGRINQILRAAAVRLGAGDPVAPVLEQARAALAEAGLDRIDYLELRAADDLAPMTRLDRPARLLTAVHVGATRLIDNMPVSPAG